LVRICFVCLGNICRSPTAEAVMRHLVAAEGLHGAFEIDSAGTGAWHVGEPPDERSVATARRRGIAMTGAARQFRRADFARFDHVIAMDRDNVLALQRIAADDAARAKIRLLRSFDPAADGDDVPDPYYGGERGFEEVLDICEAACRALLQALRRP
jgi:protein-tyrosine phosphatase